ncbi:unnamed protein product [Effrenium voratum]|nr:unnamed protein product [Effrenium voratum]
MPAMQTLEPDMMWPLWPDELERYLDAAPASLWPDSEAGSDAAAEAPSISPWPWSRLREETPPGEAPPPPQGPRRLLPPDPAEGEPTRKVQVMLQVLACLGASSKPAPSAEGRLAESWAAVKRERVRTALRLQPALKWRRQTGKAVPFCARRGVLAVLRQIFPHRFRDEDVQVQVARPLTGADGCPKLPRLEATILGRCAPASQCCQETVLSFLDAKNGVAVICLGSCAAPALELRPIAEELRRRIWGPWLPLCGGVLPKHRPPPGARTCNAPVAPKVDEAGWPLALLVVEDTERAEPGVASREAAQDARPELLEPEPPEPQEPQEEEPEEEGCDGSSEASEELPPERRLKTRRPPSPASSKRSAAPPPSAAALAARLEGLRPSTAPRPRRRFSAGRGLPQGPENRKVGCNAASESFGCTKSCDLHRVGMDPTGGWGPPQNFAAVLARGHQRRARRGGVGPRMAQDGRKRILVLGAGVSGLAAAKQVKTLAPEVEVTVLEARDRLGGRVWSDTFSDGSVIEMGAQWLHGAGPEHPIAKLAQEHPEWGELLETDWDTCPDFERNGEELSEELLRRTEELFEHTKGLYEAHRKNKEAHMDEPLWESLKQLRSERFDWARLSREEAALLRWRWQRDTEWIYAAPLERLSSKWWDADSEFEGPDCMWAEGFRSFTRHLAEGCEVRFGCRAVEVKETAEAVEVRCEDEALRGDLCIVSLPLGVLKARGPGAVHFSPALAPRKVEAVEKVGLGLLNKVALRFEAAFWPEDIAGFDRVPPRELTETESEIEAHEWVFLPSSVGSVAVAYFCCDMARRVEQAPEPALTRRLLSILAETFGQPLAALQVSLQEVKISRWEADELAQGSYSFLPLGATPADRQVLAEPHGRAARSDPERRQAPPPRWGADFFPGAQLGQQLHGLFGVQS